jgi:hypothetical protein
MMLKCFSIYDEKAKAFLPPFYLPQEGMAIREFASAANDPDTNIGKYPQDYTLFTLGTFDDENGAIHVTKQSIGNGVEYVQPQLADSMEQVREISNGASILEDPES